MAKTIERVWKCVNGSRKVQIGNKGWTETGKKPDDVPWNSIRCDRHFNDGQLLMDEWMATSTQTDISIGWLSPTKYWKGICGNRIDPICISIQTSRVSWEPIGSCLLCVRARIWWPEDSFLGFINWVFDCNAGQCARPWPRFFSLIFRFCFYFRPRLWKTKQEKSNAKRSAVPLTRALARRCCFFFAGQNEMPTAVLETA